MYLAFAFKWYYDVFYAKKTNISPPALMCSLANIAAIIGADFWSFFGSNPEHEKVEQRIGYIHQPYLVGGWATHLKNMLVKMGISPK